MPDNTQQLETMPAPAQKAAALPESLQVLIPLEFKAYLVRKKRKYVWLGVIFVALWSLIEFWPHPVKNPWSFSHYYHIFLLLTSYLVWHQETQRPWYYTFSQTQAKLVGWGTFDWFWYHFKWQQNPYVGLERGSWGDLPAITFRRRSRNPLLRYRLLLVYQTQDEELITKQVIPFIQRHGTLVSEGAWYQRT